jgi:hypothetical protein
MRCLKPNKFASLAAVLISCAMPHSAYAEISKLPSIGVSCKAITHLIVKRHVSISGRQACNIVEACSKARPDPDYKEFCADDEFMKKLNEKCSEYRRNRTN